MTDDPPIPRDGKLRGWKHPTGTRATGGSDAPDACPFCGTDVPPIEGVRLGQPGTGDTVNPEPWQQIGKCPNCGASLVRIPGDPWTGTSA